jgi:hypothetical protein
MEVSRKLHNPTNLLWGKSPHFPFDRIVGTAHGQSGCSGEEKHHFHCWKSNPSCPAVPKLCIATPWEGAELRLVRRQ